MVVIAHVSDIHIDDGERSVERARRVLQYVARLPRAVDVVVVTGDVADHGLDAEYAQVRELVDLPVPVLLCPGNHDVRAAFRAGLLGEARSDGPVNQARVIGGALFALCDSSIPGRDDGWLGDETLRWLDAELTAAADRPAFVCFHHPPVELGAPAADGIRQFGADRLAELVARHPNVVALLCGHAHTPAATTLAGRPVLVGPGVVSTLMLPFESDAVVDLDLPPMLAFHLLMPDRRVVTHYRVVA
ncbi:metallophosphoesterase [Dactylosporangium sp. NPDC005572]|uniref:metallophosphoesterase n=1 Tax=Dactylosporangium sp. NPDC005572 TaxID=3156889 RepID=UPI0033AEC744